MKTPPLAPDPTLIDKISPTMAAHWGVIPLAVENQGCLVVATADDDNLPALDNLSVLFERPIRALSYPRSVIDRALQDHFGLGAPLLQNPQDGVMVDFVDNLIAQAFHARATDIHIEPYEETLLVRFRIDGLLHPIPVSKNLSLLKNPLLSRIKVMAHMNIAEKRLPQDGRIHFQKDGLDLDIRVSTLPTLYGESIDLRLLPRTRLILGLEQLGMGTAHLRQMNQLIEKPNGIILVTGPTGHGKTTTLYACLSQINTPDKKIITIEDPIEYRLKGINQIQVHSKIGLSFAQGLRSILRQDPDVIMVGEIRDADTAEIAIRSSLTGHLVFSTLHTNDAVGAITRLMDMGIEPYLVASSLKAVVAQRLVRVICSSCATRTQSDCSACRGTGFSGRTALFELLFVNEEIRSLILSRATSARIRQAALKAGMKTLGDHGHDKIQAQQTTWDEVRRVTEAV